MHIFKYSPLKIQCIAILLDRVNLENWALVPPLVYTLVQVTYFTSGTLWSKASGYHNGMSSISVNPTKGQRETFHQKKCHICMEVEAGRFGHVRLRQVDRR